MSSNPTLFSNILLFGIYFPLLTAIAILIIYKLKLLISYLVYIHKTPVPLKQFNELPYVTIQLPIFNEPHVVERLISSAISVCYPKEKLEIQILDDSTDETLKLTQALAEKYRQQGFRMTHIHRTDRQDYKAGALQNGLKVALGDYVAIFDSDFIIPENFVSETIHFFTDTKVGMVQARWGFLNEKESLLTKLQTSFLNGHFIIEHTARNRSGHFFNFNGTAGIWRKKAIFESGSWQGDTLTEDLDLSYRAQINKWNFIYLKDLIAYSELPPTLDAFYSQQFRWVKGMFQVFLKIMPKILRSKTSLPVKIDAICHLASCFGYIFSIFISLFTVPVLIMTKEYIDTRFLGVAIVFVVINCFMIWLYYFMAEIEARGLKKESFFYPLMLLIFSIGFSINGVYAIKEALFNKKKSIFIRTPKFNNIQGQQKRIKSENNASPVNTVVGFFALYFLILMTYILIHARLNLLPALLFFSPSYFWLFFKHLKEKHQFRSAV
ncbi:MAG: hypothetical protein A2293_01980 [Elusimicrobia bacterium RIFOXYB2_FULL_49_7]|nr:MAG: hypothetical protein A2293_01980 [Elusimicrobia bacterium RIFOXYB2_FULL_49_7]